MILKDRILLGIEKGQFKLLSLAEQYAQKHSLKIELRTIGRDNSVQFKFFNKPGWHNPEEWAANYRRQLMVDRKAMEDRFDSLGITGEKGKPAKKASIIIDMDQLQSKSIESIQKVLMSAKYEVIPEYDLPLFLLSQGRLMSPDQFVKTWKERVETIGKK